jgi:DNA-binding transcriptional LysR family regulator
MLASVGITQALRMGVSVVPTVAIEADLAAGRLVALSWSRSFEALTQLVWSQRRTLGSALTAFIDTARVSLRN